MGARARCQRELQELALTPEETALFNRLAASVVFTNPGLRDLDAVAANRLGQPGLWPHSISGDLPIVLVKVAKLEDEMVVRQLVQWHTYASRRGLPLDLVILDERAGEPADRLRRELQTEVAGEMFGKSSGVFLLTADTVPADDAVLLAAAARAVIVGGRGPLTEQIDRQGASRPALPSELIPDTAATEPVPHLANPEND